MENTNSLQYTTLRGKVEWLRDGGTVPSGKDSARARAIGSHHVIDDLP